MIRHMPRGRSGITLTEILISILILGVGIVSLATLFPLGLLRLRDANRFSRSAYLTESAGADLGTRNLLAKPSFLSVYPYDPWLQDMDSYPPANLTGGLLVTDGPGLPVAYDPLWRFQTGIFTDYVGTGVTAESRFASGVGYLRADPAGGAASAYGLPRITNFITGLPNVLAAVPDIFVSPEDYVMQAEDGSPGVSGLSPVVPDLSSGTPVNDWRYTWMFTGQQSDASDPSQFDGSIVVFENRPFALDQVLTPYGGNTPISVPAGEPVVEAIFGYGGTLMPTVPAGGSVGYAAAAKRVVLLRWSTSQPDPEVKVGSWIADVTYERDQTTSNTREGNGSVGGQLFPYQRCFWYQVVKRTLPDADALGNTAYRSMTVWVGSDLQAQTLLNGGATPTPFHLNAALVSPYVVNVFPRTVYTR